MSITLDSRIGATNHSSAISPTINVSSMVEATALDAIAVATAPGVVDSTQYDAADQKIAIGSSSLERDSSDDCITCHKSPHPFVPSKVVLKYPPMRPIEGDNHNIRGNVSELSIKKDLTVITDSQDAPVELDVYSSNEIGSLIDDKKSLTTDIYEVEYGELTLSEVVALSGASSSIQEIMKHVVPEQEKGNVSGYWEEEVSYMEDSYLNAEFVYDVCECPEEGSFNQGGECPCGYEDGSDVHSLPVNCVDYYTVS